MTDDHLEAHPETVPVRCPDGDRWAVRTGGTILPTVGFACVECERQFHFHATEPEVLEGEMEPHWGHPWQWDLHERSPECRREFHESHLEVFGEPIRRVP